MADRASTAVTAGVWTQRDLDLPGRGRIRVNEAAGPAGAPTLALLHGLAATGTLNWFTVMPALAERFHVIVVDHRGHGGGIRTSRFRLADCADDVAAVADQLGIGTFAAVGYSMGGPIAKLCWSRHPDRVDGLVLCATARHFIRPQVRELASAVMPGAVIAARIAPRFFLDRLTAGMLEGTPDPQAREFLRREMAGTDPSTLMQAVRALIRFSSHDWLSSIDVPTAVLVTTRDNLVPPKRQYELAASIPGARVFEVEGDHFACVRAADRFVPALVAACEYVTSARVFTGQGR